MLGQTGTGKTMFSGAEMGRCFLRGIRVLAVDPLGDYRRLTAELGGTYLELGAGAGLNPFALTGATGDVGLTAKLSSLTRLVAAMVGGLSRDERPILDRALRAVYQDAGIGPDPATHDRTPPTIADLATRIEAEPGGRAAGRSPRALGIGLAGAALRRRRRAAARSADAGHRPGRDLRSRNHRWELMDVRFEAIDARFEAVDSRFAELAGRFSLKMDNLESRIVVKLGTLMTLLFGLAAAAMALLR